MHVAEVMASNIYCGVGIYKPKDQVGSHFLLSYVHEIKASKRTSKQKSCSELITNIPPLLPLPLEEPKEGDHASG